MLILALATSLRSLENQPLLLCVHIGCHGCWCGQLLPSIQGPGRPPQDVPRLSVCPPVSPPPPGLVPVTLCTTTCNCVQHTPVLGKETTVGATCSSCLLPPPFLSRLLSPYSYFPTLDSKTELGLLRAEHFISLQPHFAMVSRCVNSKCQGCRAAQKALSLETFGH